MKFKLLMIKWEDASSKEQYHPELVGDNYGLSTSYTVGILIEENEKCITLAQTYHEDTNWWRDLISIPKSNILQIDKLTKTKD